MPDCQTMLAAAEQCDDEHDSLQEAADDAQAAANNKAVECWDRWMQFFAQCMSGVVAMAKRKSKHGTCCCRDWADRIWQAMTAKDRSLWLGRSKKADRYAVLRRYAERIK